MKHIQLFTILFLLQTSLRGQNIGIGTNAPNASAVLEIKASHKGLLIPRTSMDNRVAIVNPAKGLLLYDTTYSNFWFHNGLVWAPLAVDSNAWHLNGNGGSDPESHFIGTTDDQPLRFRLNNVWAGEIHPTSGNVFIGPGSGQSITTGKSNTAFGDHSLFSNTEGNRNTANGKFALNSNTVGSNNTALGNLALYSNLSGRANTAHGYAALYTNTIGMENTAIGELALYNNISGSKNVSIGNYSLYSNTLGNNNTASGYGALTSNNTGSDNTANGYQALYSNTTGYQNTANGYQALYFNNSGNYNAASGYKALYFNTFANGNTAAGHLALHSNSAGDFNTADGHYALYANTTGKRNTATGGFALIANTTGEKNIAIGDHALSLNITGSNNIAIGVYSGPAPGFTNLNNTIGIGNDGGFQHGGSNQVVIGNESMLVIGGKVGWSVISDARVKNTIKEEVKGLVFILKLRPVTYHISNKAITDINGNTETPDFSGKYDCEKVKYSGFLAQEVEQAAKAANYEFSGYDIPKSKSGYYTIKYAEFVVPLVKGMQEQQQMIVDLKKSNEDLSKTIEQLLIRLEKLETK